MKKMNGKSKDIVSENIQKLKELFPEAFTEGKLDFEALKEVLGTFVDDRDERYRFTWNGKSKARMIAQTPSTGTLRPCKEESVDWDTTQNIFIEGDNLEVLKLLQKSYHRKVKMIYIDPPYNTGKDFVYKDNFKDSIKNYKEITSQVDGEGRNLSNNPETSGRYHTDWLNMMYPRLKLARNLLKDDGVIFISIDDNEVSNLRKMCDEIFGEENFVGTVTWEKRTKAQNTEDAKTKFQPKTEYVLLYKKTISKIRFNLVGSGFKSYDQIDERGEYRIKRVEQMSALGMRGRETMIFPILGISPEHEKQWKFGKDTIEKYENRGDLILYEGWPAFKIRPEDEDSETYFPFWSHFFDKEVYGTAESGKTELSNILGTKSHGFETVKPTSLITKLLFHQKVDHQKNIFLDFFAGSASSCHSIFLHNLTQKSSWEFIAVQIPEPCNEDAEMFKAGFKTISDLSKERIRRAAAKIKEELSADDADETDMFNSEENNRRKSAKSADKLDLGFKVFKLDSTNIKPWEMDFNMSEQDLLDQVENIKTDRREEDVLYEVLLKYGLDLTLPITEHSIAGQKVFDIGMGALIICLSDAISLEVVEGIAKLKDELNPEIMRVVFKDSGFKDDVVKTNAVQILRTAGIVDVRSL